MTDGSMKYIWRPGSGREQLFNLKRDPQELKDLASEPGHKAALELWRGRMVMQLKDRPEGFSDGEQLHAGCRYPAVLPFAWAERMK